MKNIKLLIEYDGTNYHGWQKQKITGNTLQGIIEDKLYKVTEEKTRVISAARTDAGVHAFEQVASFKTDSHLNPGIFQRALNAMLPEDIRILSAEDINLDFHPRYDAVNKTYFYLIANMSFTSAFLYKYAWRAPYQLYLDRMKSAGDMLIGRHDFSAFRGSGCGAKNTVREIISLEIEKINNIDFMTVRLNGNFIKISVTANAFLRHMVRNIVGTLIEIGRGRMTADAISEALKLKDRKRAGPTAPANGLFLEKIRY